MVVIGHKDIRFFQCRCLLLHPSIIVNNNQYQKGFDILDYKLTSLVTYQIAKLISIVIMDLRLRVEGE